MTREEAKEIIKANWQKLYPVSADKKGIICPLCGHGTHGDGIVINKQSSDPYGLKCFGCGFSGDVISLIEQHANTDYNKALERAADWLGITIDRNDTYSAAQAPQRNKTQDSSTERPAQTAEALYSAQSAAGNAYSESFKKWQKKHGNDPTTVSYLTGIGISIDTAAAVSAADEIAAETADPEIDTEIYNGSALYTARANAVFVTEEPADAMSVIEAGAAAVAINGTGNIDILINQLKRKPTQATLILALNNDEAGKKAMQTLRADLQQLNTSHITADICGGYKTPNEYLIADKNAFIAATESAQRQATTRPDNTSLYIDRLMQEDIDRLIKSGRKKTGYSNLDSKTGGLYAGLYVLAAATSVGKTTWALQLADQMAATGRDVIFFSLEQSRLELVTKSLTRIIVQDKPDCSITSLDIRHGLKAEEIQKAISSYKASIADRLSIVEGNFNCDVSYIRDYVEQYIQRNGEEHRPIIIIDYLQILTPEKDERGRTPTTREAIDEEITELKRLSRKLDLTIIVISSVNRSNYMQAFDNTSLKESGGIEYSADVVWGLQLQCLNDDLFYSGIDKNVKAKRERISSENAKNPRAIELKCRKNRYGIADFSCYFNYYSAQDLFTVADEPVKRESNIIKL